MALDFPSPATTNQVFSAAGASWKYDGAKWVSYSATSGDITSVIAGTGLNGGATSGDATLNLTTPVSVPNGGTNATTAAAALTSLGAVAKAGDTMSGNLNVSTAGWSQLGLLSNAGNRNVLGGYIGGTERWDVELGDGTAESGGNVGSNFTINSYTDTGAYLGTPLSINRATGNVGIGITPTAKLHVNGTLVVTNFIQTQGSNAQFSFTDQAIAGQSFSLYAQNGNALLYASVANANVLTISNATGNVGIGTSPQQCRLTAWGVGQNTAAINTGTNAGSLMLDDNNATSGSGGSIIFSAAATAWRFASIQGQATNGANNTQGDIGFSTRRIPTDAVLTATAMFGAGGLCYNGAGTWTTFSDVSLKSDIMPYERGLDAVLALEPVAFRYNEKCPFYHPDDPVRYGLIADQVRPHVPEAVGVFSRKPDLDKEETVDLLTLDPTHLVYVLINAVKELAAEVAALKGSVTC